MTRQKERHPLQWLALLGLLGIGALWDPRWQWCVPFVLFGFVPALVRFRPDERFQANLARAGRDAFAVAMAGLTGLAILAAVRPEFQVLAYGVVVLYLLLTFTFTLALLRYERRGG